MANERLSPKQCVTSTLPSYESVTSTPQREEIHRGRAGQSVGHHALGSSNVTVLRIGALRELIKESAEEDGAVKQGSKPRDGESIDSGQSRGLQGGTATWMLQRAGSLTFWNESDQGPGSWRTE